MRLVLVSCLIALVLAACSESDSSTRNSAGSGSSLGLGNSSSLNGIGAGGAEPTGGRSSNGGTAQGGTPTTAQGRETTGGANAAGGDNSTGGKPLTGGSIGSGGATGGSYPATGGSIQTSGGRVGAGGTTGVGGRTPAGGTSSTGGAPVTGGSQSSGGTVGTGGVTATGGSKPTGGTTSTNTTPATCTSGSACIDFTVVQQEIDGLGAAAPGSDVLSTEVLDAAFKNDTLKQMGLSILRVEIDPAGQSAWGTPKTNGTNAKARGAKYVFASIWSPPASMKTNASTIGGSLSTSSYADYAAFLKSFYTYMGGPGGAVDIISVQNEPNVVVTYISATWSATQLYNFTKNNAQAIGAPYMMPETYNYDTSYSDPTLNDATAAANVSYIGLHLYGAQMRTYTLAVQKQKKIWMTEHFFDPEDIGTMMSMAKEIMDCFNNQMNAYVWWYLVTPNCNLTTSSGTLTNKGYVMGQFSKYIRPGAHRASATYQPQNNVNVQAFAGTPNVIVALNRGTSAVSQTFAIAGGGFTSLHKYTTSNSKKLSDDGAVAVTNNSFTVSLDAQSVTTFVAAQ
jgi:glucuronoarabinoxylan endo-1,4-beta-xylanase